MDSKPSQVGLTYLKSENYRIWRLERTGEASLPFDALPRGWLTQRQQTTQCPHLFRFMSFLGEDQRVGSDIGNWTVRNRGLRSESCPAAARRWDRQSSSGPCHAGGQVSAALHSTHPSASSVQGSAGFVGGKCWLQFLYFPMKMP